jgi:hypothetical protein
MLGKLGQHTIHYNVTICIFLAFWGWGALPTIPQNRTQKQLSLYQTTDKRASLSAGKFTLNDHTSYKHKA